MAVSDIGVGFASVQPSPDPTTIANIRSHAAAARALLDELDRATDPELAAQLGEELARIGEQLVGVARALDMAARRAGT